MNKLFSLTLPAMLALSLAPRLAQAQPQDLTAQQILEASARAYAGLSQYKGTCSIIEDSETSMNGEPARHMVSSATSTVTFERDGAFKVSGTSSLTGRFEALASAKLTYIDLIGAGDYHKRAFEKITPNAPSSVEFLASLIGVSGGGGGFLPTLLLNDSPLNLLRLLDNVELEGVRDLGATPCYVLTRTDATPNSVTTLWIEKSSLLLRRMDTKVGKVKTPEITEQQTAKHPQLEGMAIPARTLLYNNRTIVFSTEYAK